MALGAGLFDAGSGIEKPCLLLDWALGSCKYV
jgi:hypothetical protein